VAGSGFATLGARTCPVLVPPGHQGLGRVYRFGLVTRFPVSTVDVAALASGFRHDFQPVGGLSPQAGPYEEFFSFPRYSGFLVTYIGVVR
jgi:hypothetical protein